MERRLGGRLLDKPKQILFQYGGGNLCLTIEELSPGWRSKLAANYQVSNNNERKKKKKNLQPLQFFWLPLYINQVIHSIKKKKKRNNIILTILCITSYSKPFCI